LVVMIYALATLLVPAYHGRRYIERRAKDATVIRAIVNAVGSYIHDYGHPPLVAPPRNEREKFIFVGDPKSGALSSNAGLFDVLRAIPRGVNGLHLLNPRQQKYFDESKATDPRNPRDGFADGKEFSQQNQGRLFDPHGSEYCVVMDISGKEIVDVSGIYTDMVDPIRYQVLSFSLGKDRELGTGGDRLFRIPKSNAPPGDVVSWQ